MREYWIQCVSFLNPASPDLTGRKQNLVDQLQHDAVVQSDGLGCLFGLLTVTLHAIVLVHTRLKELRRHLKCNM